MDTTDTLEETVRRPTDVLGGYFSEQNIPRKVYNETRDGSVEQN